MGVFVKKFIGWFVFLILGCILWGNTPTPVGLETIEGNREPSTDSSRSRNRIASKSNRSTQMKVSRMPRRVVRRPLGTTPFFVQEMDWSDEENYQTMELDTPQTQNVSIIPDENEVVAFFQVRIPRNAKTMTFSLDELPTPVSMYGLAGTPLTNADDATDLNPAETSVITISRYDYVDPLQGGTYFFVVVLDPEGLESLWDAGVETLDLTATAKVIENRVDGQLEIGGKFSSSLSPTVGCFRTFQLDVPEGLDSVRLDLDRSQTDLNLAVRQSRQISDTIYVDGFSEEIEARESLVLKREEFEELDGDKWFVDVYAPYNESFTEFDIYVTEGEDPPAALLELPVLDLETTPAENAMLATVQIGTQNGGGSGTLVSADGLILTNYHVISEAKHYAQLLGDEREDLVVVSISTGPDVPPIEYFLGKVIQESEKNDLAIVKIESGYYGQPIPEGYRFPFVECRVPKNSDLGTDLRICGYPASGSVENNPTFTISSGLLSGFLGDRYVKTDADIASGNSGGAAFDPQWRLIGVPTMTIEDPNGSGPTMGILMSLKLIPDSWGLEIAK